MTEDYLEYLAARLRRVDDIEMGDAQPDSSSLLAEIDGGAASVEVKRDLDPAPAGDVNFVANALSDMRRLVEALLRGEVLPASELLRIEWRLAGAANGPWSAHLERDSVGGCDIIAVNDPHDPRDLYIYIDGELAPTRLLLEVARARQDLPALVQWARNLGNRRDPSL